MTGSEVQFFSAAPFLIGVQKNTLAKPRFFLGRHAGCAPQWRYLSRRSNVWQILLFSPSKKSTNFWVSSRCYAARIALVQLFTANFTQALVIFFELSFLFPCLRRRIGLLMRFLCRCVLILLRQCPKSLHQSPLVGGPLRLRRRKH